MNYLVNVLVCTYNHEIYIAQCLDGLLMQKTDFKFKILIGDDLSTDNTRAIIDNYATKYPEVITPFYRKENLGAEKNARLLFSDASSKYIASCDGDDYWTDPLKLQKQVDFLENNPDFAFCYHHVYVMQEKDYDNMQVQRKANQPEISTIAEILKKSIWPHIVSVVLRNEHEIPSWFSECPSGDWALLSLITGEKKIKYIDETMAVYRQHNRGIWSSKNQKERAYVTLKTAHVLNKYLVRGKNKLYIYWPIHYAYNDLFKYYKTNNPLKASYYFLLSITLDFSFSLRKMFFGTSS